MDFNNDLNTSSQDNTYYGGVNPSFRNPGMSMAAVSLFLGIASIFTMLTVFLPLVFGGLAIVFAILSKGYGRKMIIQAKIGLISGIGGLCIMVMALGASMSMLLSNPDTLVEFGKQYDATFENIYGQSSEEVYGTSFEEIMTEYANMIR